MAGVEVTNLTFSYSRRGSNLENINMLVPKGTIYGLLGPSGCCKTTLLRCIVGRLKPREGTVKVFGFKPGESFFSLFYLFFVPHTAAVAAAAFCRHFTFDFFLEKTRGSSGASVAETRRVKRSVAN